MDDRQFDAVTRLVGERQSRRSFSFLAGALAIGLLGVTPSIARKKKKKSPFCLNGQTVEAGGKQKKKLLKQGATSGACPPPPPPPPPRACTPQCGNRCGGSDGCGGACACAANAICSGGTCLACTVTCNGNAQTCGEQLGDAMANGGTIVACPGLYGGNYSWTSNTTLIGAGPGNDPATSTILDGQKNGRVLFVTQGVTAVLNGVRVTNGLVTGLDKGGGISALGGSSLQLTNCAVVGNESDAEGGGIHTRGSLQLTSSRVANNTTTDSGGGIFLEDAASSSIVNSIIEENEALGDSGGGILATIGISTELTISGSTIQRNEASEDGGGLRIFFGKAIFDAASRIVNNTAFNGTGGGIRATNDATVSLNGAEVSGNSSPECSGC